MSEATPSGAAMRVFGWAVLAVVCALSYANALNGGFVYDDLVNITQRASLRWTEVSFSNWLAAVVDSPSKRPVALATFGLQYAFGLDSPRAFHAINVVVHFLNGVLVAALAQVLFERAAALQNQAWRLPSSWLPYLSLAVALVFITHPLQTQSVTYVVQRMNSLAATFHIFALLCFIWGRRSPSSGRRASLFGLALVSWVLGLGSKETAAVAPLAAWLYELYFERDLSWAFVRQSGALGLLVGVPTLIATYVLLEMSGYQPFASYPEKDFNAWERLLSQPRILVFYLSQAGWPLPSRLSLLHDFEVSRSLMTPATTLPAIAAIGLGGVFAIGLARRHRLLSFALVWFFLHLAIESSVLPLALAMEHRMYLPLFGLSLGAVVLAARVFEGRAQQALAALAVVVLLLGSATHIRNRVWLTPENLWRDVLEKYPDDFVASLNLGFDLAGQGRHAEALEQYRHAEMLKPGDTRVQTNLGTALAGLGRYQEAIPRFREALRLDPENPLAPAALGRSLAIIGEHDEAVADL
ncbi:MAG: tetratricopeptide repeat protein, partial [Myxococcota bacterium]|nr:tetratricopeptide repeat protein [Myxococcota bacterium]